VNDVERQRACPCCGFAAAQAPCPHCSGTVRALDGRSASPPRRERWHALLAGFAEGKRALFALLHGREFIGLLRVPVAANTVAFASFVLVQWLVLAPLANGAFASRWPLLDGVRSATAGNGAARWLLTTWMLLCPVWIDLFAGALQEPLRAATEARMLGVPRTPWPDARAPLRLRDRARVAVLVLLALPVLLVLVLVPWVGVPLVVLAGAVVAAVVWFEAPMARRALPLPARLRLLLAQPWRCVGTGLAIQLAAAVPFVNLLALAPLATVAATASFLQLPHKDDGRRAPAVTAAV
jgi:hypothetical protein